ncbi:MAG: dienelactone hydrolase family protein [Planctomycetota bacterium]
MILREETVDLPTPSGPMRTYIYRPVAEGRFPGLLLFSEIFQRTGPIGRMAAMFAGHGFLVAVPEIFHELEPPGSVIPYDAEGAERGNRHKLAKPVTAFDDDARNAIAWLRSSPACTGAIGAVGWCIGGHLAYRAALLPEVRATACFYATDLHQGSLGKGGDDSLRRAADIQGELMMVWGRQDPHVPDEGRALIHRALAEAKVRFTWHEHHAAHAFMRDEGPRYDPALALVGYRAALDLYARNLS